MKRPAIAVTFVLVLSTTGCKKLLSAMHEEDAGAGAVDASSAVASAAPTATASAAPSASASTTPATTKAAAAAAVGGKKPMAAPSPTTDRVGRNRDKDGPCPSGFVEQPGVENHSVCARACKKDADCHGHTCVDSDVGDGKVCSDVASKPGAADAGAKAAPVKCKADEIEDGNQCLKTCTKDSDCPKKGTCEMMKVPNPNGGVSTAMVCR